MSHFNTFCAVALLSFNIISSIYVKVLIARFHKNQNDLPEWARVAREAIEKLDGSLNELFQDSGDNQVEQEEEVIQNRVDQAFLDSDIFHGYKSMRLEFTEQGFDMRDDFELKKANKSKADEDVMDPLMEMVEVKREEKTSEEFADDFQKAKEKAQDEEEDSEEENQEIIPTEIVQEAKENTEKINDS